MSSLSPEARKLLESTRGAGGPSAAQRANMKRAVLAGALLPGTAAAASSTAAAVKAAGVGFAAKLTIAAVVAGVGVGVWVTWQLAAPSEVPAEVAVTTAVRAPEPVAVAEPVVVAEAVVVPEAPVLPAPVVAAPRPPVRVEPAAPVVAAPAPIPEETPVKAPPPPVDEETLSREVAALSGTMNAVDAKQFSVALEQLVGYRAAFPHGALETEASVLEVLALCGLGRGDEARAIGRMLPVNNPAVRRLDRSCIAKPR